jgi:hypothetical protein
VGNIYADGSCCFRGIDPLTPADALSDADAARLFAAVRAALTDGIEREGASVNWYRKPDGTQEARSCTSTCMTAPPACTRCGAGNRRRSASPQRGTHYCPAAPAQLPALRRRPTARRPSPAGRPAACHAWNPPAPVHRIGVAVLLQNAGRDLRAAAAGAVQQQRALAGDAWRAWRSSRPVHWSSAPAMLPVEDTRSGPARWMTERARPPPAPPPPPRSTTGSESSVPSTSACGGKRAGRVIHADAAKLPRQEFGRGVSGGDQVGRAGR